MAISGPLGQNSDTVPLNTITGNRSKDLEIVKFIILKLIVLVLYSIFFLLGREESRRGFIG